MGSRIKSGTVSNRTMRLRDIIGLSVTKQGKRIGRLVDLVFTETVPIPHASHILVHRPFGDPQLSIPVEEIALFGPAAIEVRFASAKPFEAQHLPEGTQLIRDFVLNKRVIDVEDREVSVVFDVTILQVGQKLYISGVDLGRRTLFSHAGVGWLADLFRIEDDLVSWTYIQPLPESIGSFRGDVRINALKKSIADMPPVDLADIIEQLSDEQRRTVLSQLDVETASDALEEIDPNVQRQIIAIRGRPEVAEMIDEMTPAQAADVLSALPHTDAAALLPLIDADLRGKVETILDQNDTSIVDYATNRVLLVGEHERAGALRESFPKLAEDKDFVHYLFLVDADHRLTGVLDLKELLLAPAKGALRNVMNTSVVSLSPDETLRDAHERFDRYGYRALPVIDAMKTIVGEVLFRDIMQLKHRAID